MPQKQRLSIEEKVKVIQEYLDRKIGFTDSVECRRCGKKTFRWWIRQYQAEGVDAFLPHERNRHYPPCPAEPRRPDAYGKAPAGRSRIKSSQQLAPLATKIFIFFLCPLDGVRFTAPPATVFRCLVAPRKRCIFPGRR